MKSLVLRILVGIVLVSLVSGIAVSIIGLMKGWDTPTQFSDALFWASAIVVVIGFISLKGYSQRAADWPPLQSDPADRARLWGADILRGKIFMVVFGISGLLLFGLSVLVSKLF